jgi:AAA domain
MDEGLPVVRIGEIPSEEAPRRWMIEGLWGRAAVGLIGGAPKCFKSWLALDMALSVATGTPALDAYAVREQGPALVYLAEDALEVIRERIEGMARHRGLLLGRIDLHVITAPRLRLDSTRDRSRLLETVSRLRPRLLLLDPLVRLHSIDENDARAIAELLAYIRELERRFELSVILVHHTRKNASGRQAGQNLRGSSDLHAFGDSNLYLLRTRERLLLVMEHRSAAPPDPIYLELVTKDADQVHLEVVGSDGEEGERRERALEVRVLEALGRKTLTRGELRDELAVKNERLGEILERLENAGRIERSPGGWRPCRGAFPIPSYREGNGNDLERPRATP